MILAVAETSLPATNQEQMYVGASRAKEWMTLYTDDKAAVRPAVQRTSQKLAASDLLPKPTQSQRPGRGKRKQRQRRLSLINRVRAAVDAPTPAPSRHAITNTKGR